MTGCYVGFGRNVIKICLLLRFARGSARVGDPYLLTIANWTNNIIDFRLIDGDEKIQTFNTQHPSLELIS